MLCKTNQVFVLGDGIGASLYLPSIVAYNSNTTILTFYNTSEVPVEVYGKSNCAGGSSFKSSVQINAYDSTGRNVGNKTVTANPNNDYVYAYVQTPTVTVPAGGYATLVMRPYNSSWNVRAQGYQYIYASPHPVEKNNNYVCIGNAYELRDLGELGRIIIWGMNKENFVNGFTNILEKSGETTDITTGNITPGNFVGYIVVGKYKIPYYL